ncbi:hypothetical protein FVER14953_20379 [Fusarium verticillioides]|nr:hypothetical protein FVER14953_20379 [Fusarium verticillioides]
MASQSEQERLGDIPTILQFQVDDLEDEWTFTYPFDFIFARMMTGSIGDFPEFFTQSFNALSPGGWVECQDITSPAQCLERKC